jgi:hypothetical protein
MYKLHKNLDGIVISVSKTENNVYLCIPFDPANTDYQEYLNWLAESPDNIPLPADGDSNGI